MSTLSIRLPESFHDQLREVSKAEKVSINQFIMLAIGEKLSSLQTCTLLERRAAQGSEKAFRAVLSRVPEGDPVAGDELPS